MTTAARGRDHRHEEGTGVMVGVVAGLVPCPLTLFTMFFATARGVPEAGLTFALAMLLGIGLTLAGIAGLVVAARERFISLVARHDASIERLSRLLEGLTGLVLLVIGLRELLP